MKKFLLLSLFFVHLVVPESYARDEKADRISGEKDVENQCALVSPPVEHTFFIFHETTINVIPVQCFTLRFHFGGQASCPDIFYKKVNASFLCLSRVLNSRQDSKTRFIKLRQLQI